MIPFLKYLLTFFLNCVKEKNESSPPEVDKKERRLKIFMMAGTSEYFWPNLTRRDCECLLVSRVNGAFLVSYHEEYQHFELIYKRDGLVANMKIDFNGKEFSLDHKNPGLPKAVSLDGLILELMDKCKSHFLLVSPLTGQNLGFVQLKFPVKRNITLKDRCKREITRSFATKDFEGDLPRELVEFLMN